MIPINNTCLLVCCSHELLFDSIPTLNVKPGLAVYSNKKVKPRNPFQINVRKSKCTIFPLLLSFVLFIKYFCISNQSNWIFLCKLHFRKVCAHQQKIETTEQNVKSGHFQPLKDFFFVCFTSFSSLWDDVSSALAHDPGYVERAVGLAGNGDGAEHRLRFQLQTEGTRHWGYHGAGFLH